LRTDLRCQHKSQRKQIVIQITTISKLDHNHQARAKLR
jgi:hypothetical protein